MDSEQRMDGLEERVALLERAVERLAPAPVDAVAVQTLPLGDSAGLPARFTRPSTPPPLRPVMPPLPVGGAPAPRAPRAPRRRPELDLEELLGGRVLAWVGAIAVLMGIFLLLVIAVSRGWIGEAERTAMGGLASLALLIAGAWLHERRGRTEASLAAAATGIAGLFGSLAVAGAVYDLVPAIVALVGALAVGGAATALALRWEARGIGALGIVGALLAPALVGAQPSGEAVALLAVATGSATAVLLWQRWNWLAFAAFAITTPQWLVWLGADDRTLVATLAVLAVFGALNAAAAVGFELRSSAPRLRISSAVLLVLNAFVLAAAGWLALSETVSDLAGHMWLVALAVAHAAVGLAGGRTRRVSHELSLAALALAVVLGDVALASIVDGLPLLLGWAGSGVAFAALARRGLSRRGDEPFAAAGLGGHLLLALGHALVLDAPPDALGGGFAGAEALVALAVVAAGCAVSARLAETAHPHWRTVLDGAGLAVLAYLTAVALDGAALTAAFAAEAVALGVLASRTRDAVALYAAGAFLLLALAHGIAVLAPPEALLNGLAAPAAAALGLGAIVAAALVLARLAPPEGPPLREWLLGGAALVALYLASVLLVTPFQPGLEGRGLELGELGVRQQGQALLSAMWALVGFGGLVAGLVRDHSALRRGALALLGLAIAKVFLYDLSSLTSIYRVVSFIVLGLLLLCGAFVWQRMRPRPPADLRDVPERLR